MNSKVIIGIDLAGPARHQDTAMAILSGNKIEIHSNLSDQSIYDIAKEYPNACICIDAPLSYSETGGFRASDHSLRKHLNDRGFTKIGLMAPTYNRMIYLTARGIRLTRLLSSLPICNIYESHPGAFLALSSYNYEDVIAIKSESTALQKLAAAIEEKGYQFNQRIENDHQLMAVACALSGEQHLKGQSNWHWPDTNIDAYDFIA